MGKVEVTVLEDEKKKHAVFTTLAGVKVEWGLQGFSNIKEIRDVMNKNFQYTRGKYPRIHFKKRVRNLKFAKKMKKIRRFPRNPPPVDLCIPFYHQPADITANLNIKVPIGPNVKFLGGFKRGRDPPVVPGWLIELHPELYKDIAFIKWCLNFIQGKNIAASVKILQFIINHRMGIRVHPSDICQILKLIPRGDPNGLSFPHFMYAMANPTVARQMLIFREGSAKAVAECDIWKVFRKSSEEECKDKRKAENSERLRQTNQNVGLDIRKSTPREKHGEVNDSAKKSLELSTEGKNSKKRLDIDAKDEMVNPKSNKKLKSEVERKSNENLKSEIEPKQEEALKSEIESKSKGNLKSEVESKQNENLKSKVQSKPTANFKSKVKPNPTDLKSKSEPKRKENLKSKVESIPKKNLKSEVETTRNKNSSNSERYALPPIPSEYTEYMAVMPRTRMKFRPRPGKKIKFARECKWHDSDSESSLESDDKQMKVAEHEEPKTNVEKQPELKSNALSNKNAKELADSKPEDADNQVSPAEPKKQDKVHKHRSFWQRLTGKKSEEEVEEVSEIVEIKEERKHGRGRRSITTTIRLRLRNANPTLAVPPGRNKNARRSMTSFKKWKNKMYSEQDSGEVMNSEESKAKSDADNKGADKKPSKKKERLGPSFEEAFANYGSSPTEDIPLYGRRMSDTGQLKRLRQLREDEDWKLEMRRLVNPKKYPDPLMRMSKMQMSARHAESLREISTTDPNNSASQKMGQLPSQQSFLTVRSLAEERPNLKRTFHEALIGETFTTIHGEIIIKDDRAIIHGIPQDQFWNLETRDREKQVKSFKKSEKKRLAAEKEVKRNAEEAAAAEAMRKNGIKSAPLIKRKGPVKPDMNIPTFEPITKEELVMEQEKMRAQKLANVQPWSSLVHDIQERSGRRGLSYKNAKTITKEAEVIISESHRDFMGVWGSMPIECKDEFFTKYLKQKKKEMATYLKEKEEEAKLVAEEKRLRKKHRTFAAFFRKAQRTGEPLVVPPKDSEAETDRKKKKKKRSRSSKKDRKEKDKKVAISSVPEREVLTDSKEIKNTTGNKEMKNTTGSKEMKKPTDSKEIKKPVAGQEAVSSTDSSESVEVPRKFHAYQVLTPRLRQQQFLRKYFERKERFKMRQEFEKRKLEAVRKKYEESQARRRAEARVLKNKDFTSKNPTAAKYRKILLEREAAKHAMKVAEEEEKKKEKEKQGSQFDQSKFLPPKRDNKPMFKRRKVPLGGYLKDTSGYTYREKIFYTGLLMFQMYDTMQRFNQVYNSAYIAEASLSQGIRFQMQNLNTGVQKKGFAEWDNPHQDLSGTNPYERPQAFVSSRFQKIELNLREKDKYRSRTRLVRQHNVIVPERTEEGKQELKIMENRWRIKKCLKLLSQNDGDCVCKLPDIENILHMSDPTIDIMFESIINPTARRKETKFDHSQVMSWVMEASKKVYQPLTLLKSVVPHKKLINVQHGRYLRKVVANLQFHDWNRTKLLRDKIRRTFWAYLKVNRIPEGRLRDSFVYSFITLLPQEPSLSSEYKNPCHF